jgi:transcriptional regulator with XRE-family HTH domain
MSTTPVLSLEEERIRRGETVEAFARFLKVSEATYAVLRAGLDEIPRQLMEEVAAKLGVAPEDIREFAPREGLPPGPRSEWELLYRWDRYDDYPFTAVLRRSWRPLRIQRPPRSLRQRLDPALRLMYYHLSPRGRSWKPLWEPTAVGNDEW